MVSCASARASGHIVLVSLLVLSLHPAEAKQQPTTGTVVGVSDQGEVRLRDGRLLALLGVELPRKIEYRALAVGLIRRLSLGKTVSVSYDQPRKVNGALLAYVGLPGGASLNATVVKEGFGFATGAYPCKRLKEFQGYQRAAQSSRSGVWSVSGGTKRSWSMSDLAELSKQVSVTLLDWRQGAWFTVKLHLQIRNDSDVAVRVTICPEWTDRTAQRQMRHSEDFGFRVPPKTMRNLSQSFVAACPNRGAPPAVSELSVRVVSVDVDE
jgi:endonuclease YncB( thermonuclease family)